jgi:hypothetical protein
MKYIYLYIISLNFQGKINTIIPKIKQFYKENKKPINVSCGVVSLIFISYFIWKKSNKNNKENKKVTTISGKISLSNDIKDKLVKHDYERDSYINFFEYNNNYTSFKDFFKNLSEDEKESSLLLEHIQSYLKTHKNNNSELFISKKPNDDKVSLMVNIINTPLNTGPIIDSNISRFIEGKNNINNKKDNINIYYENEDFYILRSGISKKDPLKLDYMIIPKKKNYNNHMEFFTNINNNTFQNFFKALYWVCEQFNLDEYFNTHDDMKSPINFIHFFTRSDNKLNMFYWCIRNYGTFLKDNKDLEVLDKYSHIKLT